MSLKKLKKLLTNKERHFDIDLSERSMEAINQIVNKSSEKKFNLQSENDLRNLTLSEIKKIDFNMRSKYQRKLVNILKPEFKKFTDLILEKNELSDFRVGPQCKYKKISTFNTNKTINYKKYTKLKDYNLPLTNELLLQTTKPHQDLSNQGFRSSMSLIFYLQLTKHSKKTCLMQVANFKNKIGLFDFDTNKIYSNTINTKNASNQKWYVPKSMKPGKIFIFDGVTPHNSTPVNEIPRIAINVKIQPRSLNYIYKIFNLKKKFKNNNYFYNLKTLENDLKYCTSMSNSLNYELSILYLLQKKFDKAFETFDKFTLSRFKNSKVKQIFAGALFRKTIEAITKADVNKIFNKDLKFEKLSCADSIIQTVKL